MSYLSAGPYRAGLRSAFFQTGPVRLHFVSHDSAQTPLVLFPGQSVSWESYHRVLPELARHFQVFAVDIHGHGQTSWCPDRYTFNAIGADLAGFLRERVGRPAILTGNSSGGLIALWLAAHVPELVKGVIPEDPPLFSAEWPRLRDACYVYSVFERCQRYLKNTQARDLAGFFAGLEVPVHGRLTPLKLPPMLRRGLTAYLRALQAQHPQGPVELPAFFPSSLRVFVKGISEYDPAFSLAFLEGTACQDFDHAATLSQIQCPVLLLHADWFVHPRLGLVGSMTDQDVVLTRKALKVPFFYQQMQTQHMSHLTRPTSFIRAVLRFSRQLEILTRPA